MIYLLLQLVTKRAEAKIKLDKLNSTKFKTTTTSSFKPSDTIYNATHYIKKPSKNMIAENSDVIPRKERLQRIYEQVLYRDGNPLARDLYKRYFIQENNRGNAIDFGKIEKAVESRRVESKVVRIPNTVGIRDDAILYSDSKRSSAVNSVRNSNNNSP